MRVPAARICCVLLLVAFFSRAEDWDIREFFQTKEITIESSPDFEQEGSVKFLRLVRGTNVYRFAWAMPPYYEGKVLLKSNQTYRFAIAEFGLRKFSLPSWPYLLGIHDQQISLYEILTFANEERAGAVIFVDECLTRGLTNAMTVAELRQWVTNTVERYKRFERVLLKGKHPIKRFHVVPREDIPDAILSMSVRIPCCRFSYRQAPETFMFQEPSLKAPQIEFCRGPSGELDTIRIAWYIYGVLIGPESYAPEGQSWYQRKLSDGIYLWHGYK